MSYEILYDKCFVKANDKYLPMVLAGSNNCYQFDRSARGRRARSWFNLTYACPDGKRYATEAELLEHIEAEKKKMVENHGDEAMENYGYYSSFKIGGNTRTTFAQYKGIFVTGMKKALTVEQLKEYDVDLQVYTYDYGTKYQEIAKKDGSEWLESVIIESTEHLFETIEKFEKCYKNSKFGWYISFDTWNLEREIKKIRREMFPRNKKEYKYVDQDHYYTAKFIDNGSEYYFVKRTKNGIRYSFSPYLKFATEKEAKKLQNRLKGKVSIIIKKINKDSRVRVLSEVNNV